jgi:hypothetical protein
MFNVLADDSRCNGKNDRDKDENRCYARAASYINGEEHHDGHRKAKGPTITPCSKTTI